MVRLGSVGIRIAAAVTAVAGFAALPAGAVFLDDGREIRLGLRTYVSARVGTQDTSKSYFFLNLRDQAPRASRTETFPYSASGHLRQNRAFAEVDLEHDILRLSREGFGPLNLFNILPFKLSRLRYHLTFRGEYEGVYDYGPSEFRTAEQYVTGPSSDPNVTLPDNPITGLSVDVLNARRRLRDIGSHRARLFQAFIDAEFGDLFIRFGRQNLSWGETDAFRLLDQINPLDSSFGGFLIPLDERRVPLDMLRVKYFLGSYGPFEEAFIEMYGAIDDDVSFDPGAAQGSAWTLPNLGKPSSAILNQTTSPSRTFTDMRGGGRLVWNMSVDSFTGTFSFAHYYTYFDTPTVEVTVQPGFPLIAFPDGYSSHTFLRPQRGQITGGTATFSVPYELAQKLFLSGEPVIRTEFAFFRDEPRYRQEELDPFLFHSNQRQRCRGVTAPLDCLANGRRTGNSVNLVIGIDHNQYIRFLNPNQTFFLTTQFFYKHLLDAADRKNIPGAPFVKSGEVLPVPDFITDGIISVGQPLEPVFVRHPTDQFLQTFVVATQYRSGTIVPAAAVFYDWEGAWVFQPGVTFIYDPFRFSVDYSFLTAGQLKGSSGVSLLRDRDNVYFRIEYTI
jgi:hypothetical protein